MIKLGVTGGIGSGKSTVCKIFETLGIPVYYADDRAKAIMTGNAAVKKAILSLFGGQAYFRNGRLNRAFIAQAVFQNPVLREKMNQIVHPAVIEDGRRWQEAQTSEITLKEAALLIQSGSYKDLDHIILVTCPEELRIKRVMQRNRMSRQAVKARINSQLTEAQMKEYADWIVVNDGSQSVIAQVLKIYHQIKA